MPKEIREAYDVTRAYTQEQIESGIDAAMEDLGNAYRKAVAGFSKS